jgi:hypothetical protein
LTAACLPLKYAKGWVIMTTPLIWRGFLNGTQMQTFPRRMMAKWLLANGTRIKEPELHSVVLMPGPNLGAMGTVLNDGHTLYISSSAGAIIAPLPFDFGHHFRLNK